LDGLTKLLLAETALVLVEELIEAIRAEIHYECCPDALEAFLQGGLPDLASEFFGTGEGFLLRTEELATE
jgi:hypothetical protein